MPENCQTMGEGLPLLRSPRGMPAAAPRVISMPACCSSSVPRPLRRSPITNIDCDSEDKVPSTVTPNPSAAKNEKSESHHTISIDCETIVRKMYTGVMTLDSATSRVAGLLAARNAPAGHFYSYDIRRCLRHITDQRRSL